MDRTYKSQSKKRVKFCRVTPKALIQVRVFPAVEFRTVRLAKRAKVMFEERIREFPAWLLGATRLTHG